MQWGLIFVPELKSPPQICTQVYKETNKEFFSRPSGSKLCYLTVFFYPKITSSLSHCICIFTLTYTKHDLYVYTIIRNYITHTHTHTNTSTHTHSQAHTNTHTHKHTHTNTHTQAHTHTHTHTSTHTHTHKHTHTHTPKHTQTHNTHTHTHTHKHTHTQAHTHTHTHTPKHTQKFVHNSNSFWPYFSISSFSFLICLTIVVWKITLENHGKQHDGRKGKWINFLMGIVQKTVHFNHFRLIF